MNIPEIREAPSFEELRKARKLEKEAKAELFVLYTLNHFDSYAEGFKKLRKLTLNPERGKKYTQSEFAEISGIPLDTIKSIECGRHIPSPGTAERIEKAFIKLNSI